jgi:hypothetical protein
MSPTSAEIPHLELRIPYTIFKILSINLLFLLIDMRCSGCFFVLIAVGVVMLENLSDAKIMLNDGYDNELQEQSDMLLEKLTKRLAKRQISK